MNLTEFSVTTRKLIPFVGFVGVVFIVLYIVGMVIWGLLFPPPPPQVGPTLYTPFEKLPALSITGAVSANSYQYALDTIEGRPISATSAAAVYSAVKDNALATYQKDAEAIAGVIGFSPEELEGSLQGGTKYRITSPLGTLDVEITTMNFVFTANPTYYTAQEKATNLDTRTTRAPANQVGTLLSMVEFDVGSATAQQRYLTYNTQTNTLVEDEAEKQELIEYAYFLPNLDGGVLPWISSRYPNANTYVVVNNATKQIVEAKKVLFEYDLVGEVGMYPLITGDQAWQALQDGYGWVISSGTGGGSSVIITEMLLGYYQPDEYQAYTIPVFGFVSNKGLVAIVPAITGEYMEGGVIIPTPVE